MDPEFEKLLKQQEFQKGKDAIDLVIELGQKNGIKHPVNKKLKNKFNAYYTTNYMHFKERYQSRKADQERTLQILTHVTTTMDNRFSELVSLNSELNKKIDLAINNGIKPINAPETPPFTEKNIVPEQIPFEERENIEDPVTKMVDLQKNVHETAVEAIANGDIAEKINEKQENDEVIVEKADDLGNEVAKYKGKELVLKKDLSINEKEKIIQDLKDNNDGGDKIVLDQAD